MEFLTHKLLQNSELKLQCDEFKLIKGVTAKIMLSFIKVLLWNNDASEFFAEIRLI